MLTYITVVFKDELEFLRIQARSIETYVDDVTEIQVIVNDSDEVIDLIDVNWWGRYTNRVKLISCSKWKYTDRVNGWESQQLLKLLAGAESPTKWSMILDAKTYFINKLDISKFFDEQGRACVGRVGIFNHFESSQQFIENYFKIKFNEMLGPGGVPFIFHTDTVKELVQSVEDFPDFFQTAVKYPYLANEFHLYAGFVKFKYKTYDFLYNPYAGFIPYNIADWQINEFDQFINTITSQNMLTASIHRRALQKLTNAQIKQWRNFLVTKNLIDFAK